MLQHEQQQIRFYPEVFYQLQPKVILPKPFGYSVEGSNPVHPNAPRAHAGQPKSEPQYDAQDRSHAPYTWPRSQKRLELLRKQIQKQQQGLQASQLFESLYRLHQRKPLTSRDTRFAQQFREPHQQYTLHHQNLE